MTRIDPLEVNMGANTLSRQIRRISEIAVAPAFSVRAIRRLTMALAVSRECTSVQYQNFPPLEEKHLDNPRLYSNRTHLISAMRSMFEGGVIAEVGVAEGDFSEYLLNELRPRKFVAFDLFTMHESRSWITGANGERVSTKVLLNNMTHLNYYKSKFGDRGDQVSTEIGMSHVNLAKYPDKFFDVIYIDADHTYEGVKQDADVAKAKLADNGIIVFDDYIMFSHVEGARRGVVQAVNELVVCEDWRVCGFALEKNLYYNIAIRKQSGSPLAT